MASPFYLFRKYQKAFLVVAGVLAMFIFVVADPLMSWLQSSNGGGGARNAKTVVASWDGGSIDLQQLDRLSQRRYKISEFLWQLVRGGAGIIEQEGGNFELPTSLPDFRLAQNSNPRSVQFDCVSTRLLADLAEKSGITVSDAVINHYLREWGLRRMGDAEMANLLKRLGLPDKTLFAGLRELMMRNFYMSGYALATRGVTPEQRWQDWKRINERIAVEAAILPTENFLSKVPEPSDADLKNFFELHKDRVAGIPQIVMGTQLPGPDPGFREPRRVRVQYLLGSASEWRDKLLDTVTEKEIADYYEENKQTQFIKTSASTSAEGLFEDTKNTENTENTENDKTESLDTKPAEETPTAEDQAPPEPSEETPPSEEQLEEQPAEEESSQLPRKSPFRLVALQTEEEEEEEETKEETGEETLSEEPQEESATKSTTESTTQPAEEIEKQVEFLPLKEVSEQIRRVLAGEKAVVELQKVVDRTYGRLKSAYNPYGFTVVSARSEEKEIPPPPAALSDYKQIARETGLASEETALLSGLKLQGTLVGKAWDAQSLRERVVQAMFGDQELYEPYRATDLDDNLYIVCKTEDVPSRVPEFEEVRSAVLTAWKKQEAAKLALEKAQELAKQAEKSGDTVATLARGAGYKTVTTDMFSWLSFGSTAQAMQRGPRLGEAPPLKAVGIDFMTQAFKLKADQKIALLNHDQSNAFVVQLNRREQPEKEMRQQFLTEANNWYASRVMNSARWGSSQRQLLGQLAKQTGLNLEKLEEALQRDSQ